MKTLTVITTTFNRAYCLHQVYESLCRQTCDDFVWLIIDDGSTDDTRKKVGDWKNENKVVIEYYYKENGGMHTARNMAYNKVYTELNVIIDSDDWMTDDAVEKIVDFWNKNKSAKYYGIISENVDTNGCLIGTPLPEGIKSAKLTDVFSKYRVKGDKKIIMRSELSRLYPFPEYPGEKFFPASYKYKMLDKDYTLLIMPEATCVVDYNQDSMTYDKYRQYRTSANGFAFYRNKMMINDSGLQLIKDAVHYIAESKFANKKHYITDSTRPIIVSLLLPLGSIFYHYLSRTKKKY